MASHSQGKMEPPAVPSPLKSTELNTGPAEDDCSERSHSSDHAESTESVADLVEGKSASNSQKYRFLHKIYVALSRQNAVDLLALAVAAFALYRTLPLTEVQIDLSKIQKDLSAKQIPLTELQITQAIAEIEKLRIEASEANEKADEAKRKFEQTERLLNFAESRMKSAQSSVDELKKQNSILEKSTESLNFQNNALEKNYRIQRFIDYLNNRPRIEITSVDQIQLNSRNPYKYRIRFSGNGKNINNIWTNITSYYSRFGSKLKSMQYCYVKDENSYDRGSISGGEQFIPATLLTPQQQSSIQKNESTYIVQGRICYQDGEGGTHYSDFCIQAQFRSQSSCGINMNSSGTINLPSRYSQTASEF